MPRRQARLSTTTYRFMYGSISQGSTCLFRNETSRFSHESS